MASYNTFPRLALLPFLSVVLASAAAPSPAGQPAVLPALPRVSGPVDESVRTVLHGNLHLRANSSADLGGVDGGLPAGRMLLLLARSPAQESALEEFIQAAHTKGDSLFQQWLRPEEFGRLYGPADSDVAAVIAWLEAHGMAVNKVHAGRGAIEFSCTAGQFGEAFHTQIHRYAINGETQLAAAVEPSIPSALAPVIAGVAPMTGFRPRPQLKMLGSAAFDTKTHAVAPQWTYASSGGISYAMAPGDFTIQYDIKPVYAAGVNGAGQTIAIVSDSNVDLSLVQAYRSLFGFGANLPVVVIDGEDPGQNADATEAYLDLEIAGSVAPGARVILYTSGGTALTDGLALAAARAVDDDEAGVISVSYGECELELGQSGNVFWNALWQQAAAQGQTVFVSTGDGGSAGCDDFNGQSEAYAGLQVNGIASTAYNVAVGGTDLYLSQYDSGSTAIAAQLRSFWSSTTTAPAVSLKQPVPEQAWNDFFGYNLTDGGKPGNLESQTIVAGGGGASSAALYPGDETAGYLKPAWQAGAGVPADQVRDLPDLSLFAADGGNSSFYPICAHPGDCSSANLNSSNAVVITGVGGTSAAAPAMAGIQSLVNQKAGSWAGQANFHYYPLAAHQPDVFRDVTKGGNQVLCYPGSANCITGAAGTVTAGYWVEGGYKAGTGYDLATGLGSVDVANLVKEWDSVTLKPTTTTLAVSPATLVHGTMASIISTVAPAAGGGTPTGTVALAATDALPGSNGLGAFSLTYGAVYGGMDKLPGGTWQLRAVYSGDATYAASKSAPVTVTVTPEADTLSATGWAWNPYDLNLYQLSSGMTLPYGAQIFLDAQPLSMNATLFNQSAPATGTVTFTDRFGSAVTTSTLPLNGAGLAEWSTGVFAPGKHTIAESYSGDASYNPSSLTSPISFTVVPGSTSLTATPLVSTVAAGGSVTVDIQLGTGYQPLFGKLPTGKVTVTLGGKSATAALQAFGSAGDSSLEAMVTFSNVAAGLLPLTASYPGDADWLGSSANGGMVIALSSKLTPTVALASSLASPTPGQTVTLTAVVNGPAGMPSPTGTVIFLGDDQGLSYTASVVNRKATVSIPAYEAANGVNLFTAVYQGDANYTSGAASPVAVTVSKADFALEAQTPELAIAPGKSGSGTLVLSPLNGFSGKVTLSVSAPSGISTTPSPAAPLVSAVTTGAVSLKVGAKATAGVYPVTITATGGGHVHTAQILVSVQ